MGMRLKNIMTSLRRQNIAYLGIQQRENTVYMVMLTAIGTDGYAVAWQNQITDDMPAEELLEKASLMAVSQGMEHIICCLALSERDVYFYEKFFPEMPVKELEQAVKLDFISAAAWQEAFLWNYMQLSDGNIRIGGIRKKDMQEHIKVCRQFFDVVQGVLVCMGELPDKIQMPGDWSEWHIGRQEAFLAAICIMQKQGLILGGIPDYKYKWNWLMAAKLLWGTVLAAGILAFGICWYADYQLDKEVRLKQNELQLLGDVAERKAVIEQDKAYIIGRNRLLAEIHDKSSPAYGMLVRLGTSMEQGIWLTSVKLQDDGNVQLQGRAAAYNQVAQLLTKLTPQGQEVEQNKGKGIILDTADRGEDGIVDFQLKGRMF